MTRREFTDPVKAEIRARSGGRCECYRMPADIRHMFPKECANAPSEVDHIYADVLEDEQAKREPLTAEDGAHLCWPCHHLIKCREDAAAKKRRNKHRVRKDRPKSYSARKSAGVKQQIQSRGFDKRYLKKMDGTVERRNV